MLERLWKALGDIIIPNSVFFGFRIDEKRPSPSREMLERLRPKKLENNEEKRKGDFCSIACALIALSNEAIIKNPQNLEACLSCKGQGVRQLF